MVAVRKGDAAPTGLEFLWRWRCYKYAAPMALRSWCGGKTNETGIQKIFDELPAWGVTLPWRLAGQHRGILAANECGLTLTSLLHLYQPIKTLAASDWIGDGVLQIHNRRHIRQRYPGTWISQIRRGLQAEIQR